MMLGHDGDNRPYPQLGVADGHHNISHHQEKPDLLEKIARIDLHHVEHFARFLEKLDAARDVDGRSILENSMIVYAGGNADPNRHSHTNLPVILAGSAGGRIETGRYLEGAVAADVQPVPRHARPRRRRGRRAPRRFDGPQGVELNEQRCMVKDKKTRRGRF